MDRVLVDPHTVGAAVVGCAVSALVVGAFWLWSEIGRSKVARPTPIHTRRVIPIYDGSIHR